MQDDPCTFYWQAELANGRTGAARHRAIQDACCLGQVPVRATTGVTNAVRRGELAPCRLFSKCAVALDAKSATSAAGRAWHARIGYRPSIVERRRGCFETRAMRREPRRRKRLLAQDLQQSMGQGRDSASHRRRELKRLASTMARRLVCRTMCKLPACQSRVVEPAIYTVRGRQAGDLRRKLRYRADSQGKNAARLCGEPSLFRRGRPRGAFNAAREASHASYLGRR
jgi:hypothetical protein